MVAFAKAIEKINVLMERNDYGGTLEVLGIIPIITTEQLWPVPERKYYSPKRKESDYRLRTDYNAFVNAGDKERERLLGVCY